MLQVPKIKSMSLARYVLSLYVSFHQAIWQIIDMIAFPEKVHITEAMKTRYKELIDLLQDNNLTQQARVDTEEQETSDSERDRLLSYIFFSITNGLRSAKAEILAAAKLLDIVTRPYRDIAELPNIQETSSIRGLITDLKKTEYASAIATLKLEDAINELEAENERFDEIHKRMAAEASARSRKVKSAELRPETDELFNDMCDLIYASGILTTEPDEITLITNIINEINTVIDDHRKTYNLSEGHKKKDEEEPADEPSEPETPSGTETGDEQTGVPNP